MGRSQKSAAQGCPRHVAPLLPTCAAVFLLSRQRGVLAASPRRSPSRFAPAAFPRGLLGFPPCRPPCNPPAKPPFRATKRLILWGGLFRGKTHFRSGNLALLSPLRGGQWARARLASWRVGPEQQCRKEKRSRSSAAAGQSTAARCSARLQRHGKFSDTTPVSRVQSTAQRHALDTVRARGNNDAQGRERPQRETFLGYPCPKLPLAFLWDELYNKTKAVRRWKERRKTENSYINQGQRKGGR